MTAFEHAMLGATLAVAVGVQRRHGWPLVALAGAAAVLPDWDGLALAFGARAYAAAHRTWGHNLLVAGLTGAIAGAAGYLCRLSARVRHGTRALLRLPPATSAPSADSASYSGHDLAAWVVVGLLASLSHLPIDAIYSGGAGLPNWPVPLFWPFSQQGWVVPIVPWGDLGSTLIFIGTMFGVYLRPKWARPLAWITLVTLAAYVGTYWLLNRSLTGAVAG